jgi:hypothetical protein
VEISCPSCRLIPAVAAYAVGFAPAMNILAIAIQYVLPVLSDKASRRVVPMQRAKAASKE